MSSPPPGLSTLITSAPRSDKIIVAKGPASTLVMSKIFTPSRGLVVIAGGGGVDEVEKALLATSRTRALILAPQLQKEDRHWCGACQGRRVQKGDTGAVLQSEQLTVFVGEVGYTHRVSCSKEECVHNREEDCVHNRRGERPVARLYHTHVRYGVLVQDTK